MNDESAREGAPEVIAATSAIVTQTPDNLQANRYQIQRILARLEGAA